MLIGLIFNLYPLCNSQLSHHQHLDEKKKKLKILDTCLYHLKLLFIYFSFYFPFKSSINQCWSGKLGYTQEINESHGTNKFVLNTSIIKGQIVIRDCVQHPLLCLLTPRYV